MATLHEEAGEWLLRFAYDANLVSRVKTDIPGWARRWDASRKAWIIAPEYVKVAAVIAGLPAPDVAPATARGPARIATVDVYYLGRARMRESGLSVAYGMDSAGRWRYLIEEAVLRAWFGSATPPDELETLYDLVGAPPNADDEALKRAIRAAMRQWHPDVCREVGAEERFKRINAAREILLDPQRRARYDAGLRAERLAATRHMRRQRSADAAEVGYRAPLLCGRLTGETIRMGDRVRITTITAWEDVVNDRGRTLIASWPRGADAPEWRWL